MAERVEDQGVKNGTFVPKWNEGKRKSKKSSNMELRNFSSHRISNGCSSTA
jgi:hypothetical protein